MTQVWEKDSEVDNCRACNVEFSLFTRKHHCRGCGKIFCNACSDDKIILKDQSTAQRACFECYLKNTNTSNSEKEDIESLMKQQGDDAKLSIRVILADNNSRVKGYFIVTNTLIITTPLTNLKKPISICHLVDLEGIKYEKKSKKLHFYFGLIGKEFTITIETSKAKYIINTLCSIYFNLPFSNSNLKLIVPRSFTLEQENKISLTQAQKFTAIYNVVSSFFSIIPSSDAIHYVESLLESEEKEFNLSNCPGMGQDSSITFDPRSLIHTLGIHDFFKSFTIDGINNMSIISELSAMIKKNQSLTRIEIKNQAKGSPLDKLAEMLQMNTNHKISDLIISGTNLKASIEKFTATLSTFPHGLRILKFSNCSLRSKDISLLIENGLMKNYPMSLQLLEIDLSGNKFDEPATLILQKFLTRIGPFSPLEKLILRACNLTWCHISRCIPNFKKLIELDLSETSFSDADIQLLCNSLEQSLSISILHLEKCNLSHTNLEAIGNSISSNENLTNKFQLNLSRNSFTGHCVQGLFKSIQSYPYLNTLNLTNCKINESICLTLCTALVQSKNCPVERLILNEVNLDSILTSSHTTKSVSLAISNLLNNKISLKSVSLSSGYSINILMDLFETLQNNKNLLELDISNNKLGDSGASSIAKLIRNNDHLVSLYCDGNNFTLPGFYAIALTVKQSKFLENFEIPWNDLTQSIAISAKNSSTFTLPKNIFMQIELNLHKNREKSTRDKNFLLAPNFTFSHKIDFTLNCPSSADVPLGLVDSLEPSEKASLAEIRKILNQISELKLAESNEISDDSEEEEEDEQDCKKTNEKGTNRQEKSKEQSNPSAKLTHDDSLSILLL